MFWIKIPALVAKNTAGDEVVLRSGKNTNFSITNVKIKVFLFFFFCFFYLNFIHKMFLRVIFSLCSLNVS